MGYIRAADVLPQELVSAIQQFVDGEMLYIPKKCEEHVSWGEKSGIRKKLEKRDKNILEEYVSGKTVSELSEAYYLSEKSIQRILRKLKSLPQETSIQGGHTIE